MAFDELNRIKIVGHLILNYFWGEENLGCSSRNLLELKGSLIFYIKLNLESYWS
jgi:hypothetical protein